MRVTLEVVPIFKRPGLTFINVDGHEARRGLLF